MGLATVSKRRSTAPPSTASCHTAPSDTLAYPGHTRCARGPAHTHWICSNARWEIARPGFRKSLFLGAHLCTFGLPHSGCCYTIAGPNRRVPATCIPCAWRSTAALNAAGLRVMTALRHPRTAFSRLLLFCSDGPCARRTCFCLDDSDGAPCVPCGERGRIHAPVRSHADGRSGQAMSSTCIATSCWPGTER